MLTPLAYDSLAMCLCQGFRSPELLDPEPHRLPQLDAAVHVEHGLAVALSHVDMHGLVVVAIGRYA